MRLRAIRYKRAKSTFCCPDRPYRFDVWCERQEGVLNLPDVVLLLERSAFFEQGRLPAICLVGLLLHYSKIERLCAWGFFSNRPNWTQGAAKRSRCSNIQQGVLYEIACGLHDVGGTIFEVVMAANYRGHGHYARWRRCV